MSDLDTILADIGRITAGDARLDVEADLRLDITTAAGVSTAAHITGSGKHLRVQTGRTGALLTGVDRAVVGRIADLLAGTGITVDVVGPAGRLATLGAGVSSRLGRLVGSPRIAPRPWTALRIAAGNPAVQAAVVILLAAVVSAISRHMNRPVTAS